MSGAQAERKGPVTLGGGETLHNIPDAPAMGNVAIQRVKRADGPGYIGTLIRRADVFDRMEHDAARFGVAFFLTAGQVEAGRRYGRLVERYSVGLSARSTLSSMLPSGEGVGGALSAIDVHLLTGRGYDRAVQAIGHGVALSVRRVRPSARGGADRRGIPDRALVDAVAIGGQTLGEVLRAHGWAVKGGNRIALQQALSAALERLRDVLG